MYKKVNYVKTLCDREYTEGETIEQKIRRITNNNDPIKDGAPLMYTDRKDGVKPEYDIRTDRFEIALDAMDKVSKTNIAKREAKMNIVKDDGGAESSNGTDEK
jgi:hypothetical protein